MCDNGNGRESSVHSGSGSAEAAYADIWKLKFRTVYSVKWHAGLYRFWRFWEESAAVLPILLSLSVVGVLLDKVDCRLSLVLAAASSVLSLFSIVKGFGARAAFYDAQRKRYSSILSRVEKPKVSPEELDRLWDEFNGVESADWEEGLEAYGRNCYNKASIQLGVPDACVKIPWYRQLTMCFF